jgi:hypothetical protein
MSYTFNVSLFPNFYIFMPLQEAKFLKFYLIIISIKEKLILYVDFSPFQALTRPNSVWPLILGFFKVVWPWTVLLFLSSNLLLRE